MSKEIIEQIADAVFYSEDNDLEYEERHLKIAQAVYTKIVEPLEKEIEKLKDENCHDYHCMCLAQQESAELKAVLGKIG